MHPNGSCAFHQIEFEGDDRRFQRDNYHNVAGGCHDCNARNGGYHHIGCDMDRCPRCGLQAISCSCPRNVKLFR